MGLLDWLWKSGGGKAQAQADEEIDLDALAADVAAGKPLKLDEILDGLDPDDAAEVLWAVLPPSAGALRVDVIERLALEDLTDAQEIQLLEAAQERVAGPAWVAVPVAEGCDLPAMLARATPDRLTQVATLVAALAETALAGGGPAGDLGDVPAPLELLQALAKATDRLGAGPLELIALDLGALAATEVELGEEPETERTVEGLRKSVARALQQGPRGGGTWTERIAEDLQTASGPTASWTLHAALVASVDPRPALLQRLDTQDDDTGWSLALAVPMDAEFLGQLADRTANALRDRRFRADDLCSPASQAGCGKCSGKEAAADDDLQLPRKLEARAVPLLQGLAHAPGTGSELVEICCEAPSPTLRQAALEVLQRWPVPARPAAVRPLLSGLRDDSAPAVRAAAERLLASWPEPQKLTIV